MDGISGGRLIPRGLAVIGEAAKKLANAADARIEIIISELKSVSIKERLFSNQMSVQIMSWIEQIRRRQES
jgi:hypothetical protein